MPFIGEECLICKKKFTENDDIVVCETCGTPYHRECYNTVNKCINTEYHENGWTFNQKHPKPPEKLSNESTETSIEDVINKNYDETIQTYEDILNQVDIDPDEKHFGISLLEFYLYSKSLTMTRKFRDFIQDKDMFSFLALLIPEYFLLLKGLYIPSIFTFLINFILSIPMLIVSYDVDDDLYSKILQISSTTPFKVILFISMVLFILFRIVMANKCLPMYFNNCIKNIKSIKEENALKGKSHDEFLRNLVSARSGISLLAISVFLLCSSVIYFNFFIILQFFLMYLGG